MGKLTKINVAGITQGFQELNFTINGVRLNDVVGPDNGLPLLLIPGQMESWQGYKCVLPELSKRFHIFVPDLRGHGKSSWTPGQYSYNICGDDLKHFIQEVIQRPALVAVVYPRVAFWPSGLPPTPPSMYWRSSVRIRLFSLPSGPAFKTRN